METSEAKAAYEELTKKFGTGHSVGKNLTLEHWDKLYGDGHLDYSVYMLLDGRYAEITEINKYLEFIYRPFYVGQGKKDIRVYESKRWGRHQDHYTEKSVRLKEIEDARGKVRDVIIGHYQTQKQAELVEMKIMTIMKHKGYLTNSSFGYCTIPLTAKDCNVIYYYNKPTDLLPC